MIDTEIIRADIRDRKTKMHLLSKTISVQKQQLNLSMNEFKGYEIELGDLEDELRAANMQNNAELRGRKETSLQNILREMLNETTFNEIMEEYQSRILSAD